jgi:hypothetical protein
MNLATITRRRICNRHIARTRLCLEYLEDRCVLSGSNPFPLVQVSSDPSPFIDSPVSDLSEFGLLRTDNAGTEPQVAVDPQNPSHVVGAWIQDAARGIVTGISFDSGNTWQEVVIPGTSISSGGTTYPRNSDPWVSFAPNGDVYVSMMGHYIPETDGTNAILVSKSTDGGRTWGAPATIILDNSSKFFNDKPSITADPANQRLVYVTWTRWATTGYKGSTMFSETTDGGQSWSEPREIFRPGKNADMGHQIVVLPDGTLVNLFCEILYRNDARGANHYDFNISLIRSVDGGQTWSNRAIKVADLLPLSDTLTVPGARGLPNPDGGPGIQALSFVPDFAVDPGSGNLYAVWEDARFSGFQHYSTAFSMSTDGGFTWSAPIQINQTPGDIPTGDQHAFLPSVAVAADGTVAVTYYDFRFNDPNPGLLTDYWLVEGSSGRDLTDPASWGNDERITDRSFDTGQAPLFPEGYFLGDYEGLTSGPQGFDAFFSMPQGTDPGNIYFRDPPLAEPSNLTADMSMVPLDPTAAGWFADRTQGEGAAFTALGNQGEWYRVDLFTVHKQEIGNPLGCEHSMERGMEGSHAAGTRRVPFSGFDLSDVAVVDWVLTDVQAVSDVPSLTPRLGLGRAG